jgi:hypothetical protein
MAVDTIEISGTLYKPNGVAARGGSIKIELSNPGTVLDTLGNRQKVNGITNVAIASNGGVSFDLVPNANISPPNTFYVATIETPDGEKWKDYWQLAAAPGTLNFGDIPQVAEPTPLPANVRLTSYASGSEPEANEQRRGVVINIEGGAGEPDRAVVCQKGASGTYAWEPVAIGGF